MERRLCYLLSLRNALTVRGLNKIKAGQVSQRIVVVITTLVIVVLWHSRVATSQTSESHQRATRQDSTGNSRPSDEFSIVEESDNACEPNSVTAASKM